MICFNTTVPSVSILIDDKGINPVAGLNYSLTCKVLGIDTLNTTVTYTWRKDDAPLSEVGPLLSFSPLRLSDAGQYSCAINMYKCPFKYTKNLTIERGELKKKKNTAHNLTDTV